MPNVLGGKGNRGVLVAALFFGLLSAVLVFVYLGQSRRRRSEARHPANQSVVVASQDVAAGTRPPRTWCGVKNVSADAVVPNTLTTTETVVAASPASPCAAERAEYLEKPTGGRRDRGCRRQMHASTYVDPEGMQQRAPWG